jgi:hypothetical protein
VACFWLLLDAAGGERARSEPFGDREAAEEWLSGRWADLLRSGVETVVLHDDADEVYRMSLREAGSD